MTTRCKWVSDDPLYIEYHDHEWGVPEYDDQKLFEMLILEGQQAGLSWITVLQKREHYRKVLHGFDPHKMAAFTEADKERLLADAGIIRNKLKVNSFIENAKAYLAICEEQSFSDFIWGFVDGQPIVNEFADLGDVPAKTETAEVMSKALKKRGFKFIGPTICYAFMQAVGMVNDHTTDCHCYAKLAG